MDEDIDPQSIAEEASNDVDPSSPVVSVDKARKQRPKRTLITAACEECRARKAKCDGSRPRCSRCMRVRKTCTYSVNPGETRQAAAKSKTESLQRDYDSVFEVLDELRSAPLSDARDMLDSLRASQDAPSFLEQFKMARTVFPQSSRATGPSSSRSSVSTGKDPVFSENSLRSSETLSASPDRYGLQKTPVQDDGRRDVRELIPLGLKLPSELVFRTSIAGFYAKSGRLFHVFDRQLIEGHLDRLFRGGRPALARIALCQLCCTASVGAFYQPQPTGPEGTERPETTLYLIARALLDGCTQESPLEAAKCCALMAMYTLISKVTVAMAYIELGMDLSRGYCGTIASPGKQQTEWREGQRTRRMLIFLGCWISSTLGYVSSNDWMPNDLPIKDLEMEGENDGADVVQIEMVKIAILKRAIVGISENSTAEQYRGIRASLYEWHQELPPVMRLSNLLDSPDITTEIRVSIYTVHLLYLGASILYYRQLLCKGSGLDTIGQNMLLNEAHSDAVTAAQQSSRILNLLLTVGGVNQRCWLSIHQAYCSSMLILHGIAERYVQGSIQPVAFVDDISQASRCMDILRYCAEVDAVAAKLVGILTPYYEYFHNMVASSTASGETPQLRRVCTELFDLVRRPFGRFDTHGNTLGGLDDESALSFGWQEIPGGSGDSVNALLSKLGPARWLDASTPHGWKEEPSTWATIKREQGS